MKKSKFNSYLKILLWVVVGAVAGFCIAIAGFFVKEGLSSAMLFVRDALGEYTAQIMGGFLLIVLLVSVLCYKKGNQYLVKFEGAFEDEEADAYEKKFDFWLNLGMMITTIIIYLSMAVFAFHGRVIGEDSLSEILVIAGIFLLCIVSVSFYQVIAVKQIRRKDPLKHGDVADMNFQKEWLESCDEGERRIIFEAGYKTFQTVKIILLFATLIATFIEMNTGGGLLTIVFLTMINILMSIIFWRNTVKLEKEGVTM